MHHSTGTGILFKNAQDKSVSAFLTFIILRTIGCTSKDGPPVKVKNIPGNSVSHSRDDEYLNLLGNNTVYIGK